MSLRRKLLYAFVTLLAFAVCIEGGSRLIWQHLEDEAMAKVLVAGQKELKTEEKAYPGNSIVFMKKPHKIYGYCLRPNFSVGCEHINGDGFAQRDCVPEKRTPGVFRVIAMGESTTQGVDVDKGNYPILLRKVIQKYGTGYKGVETINMGVSGWISDQVALQAKNEGVGYNPDLVILYVGWNDFQGYDPLAAQPPSLSWFDSNYDGAKLNAMQIASQFRSVALVTALYQSYLRGMEEHKSILEAASATPKPPPTGTGKMSPEVNYKFYLRSLDSIVNAYRSNNPNVKIALCSLVGRWTEETQKQFEADSGAAGRTWWMKYHNLHQDQATYYLARFNKLVKQYAQSHNLLFIDEATAFENLDRSRLQEDFCHMTNNGYEILADVMYEQLRKQGAIEGRPCSRLAQLEQEYQRPPRLAYTKETN